MEINSTLLILLAEGLLALIIIAIGVLWYQRHRQSKEMADIDEFVTRLTDEADLKSEALATLLRDECHLAPQQIQMIIEQVTVSKTALLQRIIQMFLKRDVSLLDDIDNRIGNLTEPYQNLLMGHTLPTTHPSVMTTDNSSQADQHIIGLEKINQHLTKQLEIAMQTMEDITGEYTRVFSGNQTALELENSSKKMIQVFIDAEHRIKTNQTD